MMLESTRRSTVDAPGDQPSKPLRKKNNKEIPMNLASIGRLVTRSALFAALLAMPAFGAGEFSATATVSPASHTGCPYEFKFEGKIKYTGKAKHQEVQYKWIRSDGADAPTQTIFFDGPGTKNVQGTTWTLSAQGHFWEAVSINYPTSPAVNSNQAGFDLKCAAPQPPALREDCVPLDPKTLKVAQINGHWKIVGGPGGNIWEFDFENKKGEADKALRILEFYKATQSCFVGRPGPSFEYLKTAGGVPTGAFPGEDCVPFNPSTVAVKFESGQWKVVDGTHLMFGFPNEAEAQQTLAIIKHYGFTQSCFVGRPGPSLQYMRK
jgi:hypothetical protein